MAKDHDIAQAAFEAAIAGKSFNEAEAFRIWKGEKQPLNIRAAAGAALWHARKISGDEFDRVILTTPKEAGSPLYGSWGMAVVSSVVTPAAQRAFRAWAAVNKLCLAPVRTLELVTPHGTRGRRSRDGSWPYQGQIKTLCGNRTQWNNSEVSLHWDRSLAGPVGSEWTGSIDHKALKWAWEAIPRPLPKLPEDVESLVDIVSAWPRRRGQRVHILLGRGTSIFTLQEETTHHTRGPAPATHYRPSDRLLRIYTASYQTGGGQWADCKAGINGGRFWIRPSSGPGVEERLPFEPVDHIVWDHTGCRIVEAGETAPSPPPPKDPAPPKPPKPAPPKKPPQAPPKPKDVPKDPFGKHLAEALLQLDTIEDHAPALRRHVQIVRNRLAQMEATR